MVLVSLGFDDDADLIQIQRECLLDPLPVFLWRTDCVADDALDVKSSVNNTLYQSYRCIKRKFI